MLAPADIGLRMMTQGGVAQDGDKGGTGNSRRGRVAPALNIYAQNRHNPAEQEKVHAKEPAGCRRVVQALQKAKKEDLEKRPELVDARRSLPHLGSVAPPPSLAR